MTRWRKTLITALVVALTVSVLAVPASADGFGERTYKVTITNLTTGQPMTPFVVATHVFRGQVFQPGRRASDGLQQLAENGGAGILAAELEGRRFVKDIQQTAGVGPDGGQAEVYVTASLFARRLSLAGMLICTNDGFAGLNGVRLPRHGERTFYGRAWDAGTEINTEAMEDLVPPCLGEGTGETNPELAENGRIHRHAGIQGIADLIPGTHGWTNPVIKVTIERVD